MSSADVVKKLCEERGIAISRFERDCGFSNGYLRNLKRGALPSDKLRQIAEYFGVTVEYLITGEDQPEPAGIIREDEHYYLDPDARAAAQDVYERPGMRVLFSAARGVSEQDLRTVATILERMKATNPDG